MTKTNFENLKEQYDKLEEKTQKYKNCLEKIKKQCKKDLKLTEPDAGRNPFAGGRYYEAGLIFDIVNKELK